MRSRFPSFFRTYWSEATLIPAFIAGLQIFNWTRVCIITEEINLFLQVNIILCIQTSILLMLCRIKGH